MRIGDRYWIRNISSSVIPAKAGIQGQFTDFAEFFLHHSRAGGKPRGPGNDKRQQFCHSHEGGNPDVLKQYNKKL